MRTKNKARVTDHNSRFPLPASRLPHPASRLSIDDRMDVIKSQLLHAADCLAGISVALKRLAGGEKATLPAYQSRREEIAVNFASLRRLQRDLTNVSITLRPLVDS